MRSDSLSHGDWSVMEAAETDIDELMTWFPRAEDVNIWGGPSFRYPFTRTSFFCDVLWGRMLSYGLRDPNGNLSAFGQLYERYGRINLARLVVHPGSRGIGVGKRLIESLMTVGRTKFGCDEFSLFVFRENTPAYACYKSMGFVVADYPGDMPYADVCYYLTRPVGPTTV